MKLAAKYFTQTWRLTVEPYRFGATARGFYLEYGFTQTHAVLFGLN